MFNIILAPILTGLSAGIYCVTTCFPFIAPIMIDKKRNKKKNTKVFLKFISGRFLGYILFGAVFGFLGSTVNQNQVNLISNISMIVFSLLLILQVLGVIQKRKICFKKNISIPLLMGFFMGINICPPFLLSLSYVFKLGNIFGGILYFTLFFISSSIYFLPLLGLGLLNKFKEFRLVGKISGAIVGVSFLIYSLYNILI